MSKQLDFARQQFIGFCHSANGYDIESLADSMGLTAEEWDQVRDDPALTNKQIEALNKHFEKSEE